MEGLSNVAPSSHRYLLRTMAARLDSRQDPTARIRSSSSRPLTSAGDECPRAGPAPVAGHRTRSAPEGILSRVPSSAGVRVSPTAVHGNGSNGQAIPIPETLPDRQCVLREQFPRDSNMNATPCLPSLPARPRLSPGKPASD